MMKGNFTKFIDTTKGYLGKHSPEILTGLGVTGMLTTVVLAVKATPKALVLLEEARIEKGEKLTPIETVKTAWKPYIPATILCVVSTTCLIGANAVNTKRNAALATAYAISERTLVRYRDKVIDTIGEKKEKEIREQIAQDEVNNNPVSNTQVIITPKGKALCMDSISGRYFRSDIESINKVVNELNRQLNIHSYVSLNDLYYELGLDSIKNGSLLGWNVYDGLIELNFNTCLAEGEPCIVVDFKMAPKYDYDKFM